MAIDEGAAFGAALLGGVAGGVWPDVPAACAATVGTREPVTPNEHAAAIYNTYYLLYRRLYPALRDQFRHLAEAVDQAHHRES
jgi:xylulokinase